LKVGDVMVFEKIFGGNVNEVGEDEYIELDTTDSDTGGKVIIKTDKIEDFVDADRIQKYLRENSVVLVKIKALREKDISELKRAIDKLRKTCIAMNGDIAAIDEDWIIVTPSFAHVARQ
jgi:SepF-like predicted cell division protein (DUF552 family)